MKKLLISVIILGILGLGTSGVSAATTDTTNTIIQFSGDPDEPGIGND